MDQQQLILAEAAEETRDIIAMMADVEIVAAMPDDDEDMPKGPPKFMVRAYNGGALQLNGWDYPVVIDLAGLTFAKSITANLHHNIELIVGHVTDPQTDGKTVDLGGIVSGTGEGAKEFTGNAANGYPWQASVEASPTKSPDFLGEGEKVQVNGQSFTGPLYVVRKSNLYGIAFLPRGADDRTSVKLAAAAASSKESSSMDPKLRAFILEMGANPDIVAANAEQLKKFEACFKGQEPEKEKPREITDIFAAAREEQDRRAGITQLVATAITETPHCDSDFIAGVEALANSAIESKKSVKDFELELLRATRGTTAKPIFSQSRGNEQRLNNQVLQAAICMSGAMENLDKKFDDKTLQAAKDQFPNGVGLKQLIMIAARANGYRGDGWDVTLEAQRYAFNQIGGRDIRAGMSTLSLPGIFSNSAYKFLLDGWGASDMAWRDITSVRPVRDFKQVSSYRLGGNFKYVKVGPGGEIKQGSVSEDTYTNQAETYGIRFAITRTDIVNDDLSALTSIPKEMGFGAADSLNEVFWTEFLNNSAFFVAGNNNVSTGVFSLTSIAAAEAVFLAQTKPNGTPLAVQPKILLVPSALYRAALTAMNSNIVIDGTATGVQGNVNTFAGNFKVVTSPFLSNSLFTGYSAVAFYLLADPARMATIETCFLNGRDTPVIEEAVAESNVLGITMRGYHDFGVNLQEPRAGVRSTGA